MSLLGSVACSVASLNQIVPTVMWQHWHSAHDALEGIAFRSEAQEISRSELQKAVTDERAAAKDLGVKTGLGKLCVQTSIGFTSLALVTTLFLRHKK